jgi:hypothetical protein
VEHLLPTVSDRRLLLKASFRAPLSESPRLLVAGRSHVGEPTGSRGKFWAFDADGLPPLATLQLELVSHAGRPLCDPWPITMFPPAHASPPKLRLLIYTCAGGHDVTKRYLPLATRTRLLERGLSFAPDAVIANGDHVYWDLRASTSRRQGASPDAVAYAGRFDFTLPVFGTANEEVLERAVGPQVAALYGTRCRSIPVFFLQDDHDYFDNDEASDALVTFPPDPFMLSLARATQRLYYPEFLPDPNRPLGLPGSSAGDRAAGLSESFGTLRYGRLAELLLYDCRRFMTMAGPTAVFVPTVVEDWLKARSAAPGASHLLHVPSMPPGWSAGKWGEWYADVESGGRPSTARPKPYWQPGWRSQHDRLLQAASAMKGRIPLFVSGDLHSIGETRIVGTNGIDLRRGPVTVILPGPLGTSAAGWPSALRGMRAQTPAALEADEALPALEENGFIIADFANDTIVVRFFRYKQADPIEAIDSLEPFRVTELARPA